MNEDVRFRADVQASAVIQSLEQLILQGSNLAARGGGDDVTILQNLYLQWVESVERALRHLLASPSLWDELHGPRWEQIARLDGRTARPFPLITDEARAQFNRLQSIVDRLKLSLVHFELPAGTMAAVPDTNVFLHWQFFRDVSWLRLLDAKAIRLVVPLLVVEQLDRRTYGRDEDVKRRAKKVLRALHEIQKDSVTPEAPAVVKPNVSLQMLGDPAGHLRSQNEDEELLDRAEHLSGLVGGRLAVVTRDKAMDVRARLRRLRCLYLAEADRED